MSGQPTPPPFTAHDVKTLAHRVHQHGAAHHRAHHIDGHDDKAARAHAIEQSAAHPLGRFEVRDVPSHVASSKAGYVPNVDGQYERVIAVYQNGVEIPIT